MVLVTLFSHVVTFTIFEGGVELSGQDVEQTIIVHESEQNDQRGIYANKVPICCHERERHRDLQ